MELRLPQLPLAPRWNLPGQSPHAGAARHQRRLAESWFLLGASPDLRAQIEATPELHPRAARSANRHSPIAGAVLLNADIDHVLGLLLLA